MATTFAIRTLVVFVIFVALPKTSFGSTQSITFFADPGCPVTGQNETFTDTIDQLKRSWIESGANSVFIVGLWKMSLGSPIVYYNTEPPHGRCVNRTDWRGNPEWLERLGPADLTSSQIIFFTEEFYTGLSYKVETEEIGQLPLPDNPRPLAMRSYLQFSKDSWTTYSEQNFMGNASHFEASTTAADLSDSFTYNESMLNIVGSVRKDLELDSSGASIVSAEIITLCCSAILNLIFASFYAVFA